MPIDLTKHNECGRICKQALEYAKKLIEYGERKTIEISKKTTDFINGKMSTFYKNSEKGLSFPVSVSLNNCVGNWIHSADPDFARYNNIEIGDIIKVHLGVYIDYDSAQIGDTYYLNVDNKLEPDKYTQVLDEIQKELYSLRITSAPPGTDEPLNDDDNPITTNTDIKVLIENVCTDNDCFPVNNTYSFQQTLDEEDSEPKYIVTNYSSVYDDDDIKLNDNIQYELVEDEIYDIDISIIPDVIETTSDFHEYTEHYEAHIGNISGRVNLKLANSRMLFNKIINKYNEHQFYLGEYDTVRDSIGKKEMISKGLLETHSIFFSNDKLPVYQRVFSVVVKSDRLKTKYKV